MMHGDGCVPIGVLDLDDGATVLLTAAGRRRVAAGGPVTYVRLLALARTVQLRQLWLHPRWTAAYPLEIGPDDPSDERSQAWYTPRPEDGTSWCTVVVPSRASGGAGPWLRARTGVELLGALDAFQAALGQPWIKGPVPTAMKLLRPQLRIRGALEPPRHWPEPALDGGLESPMFWDRPLRSEELGRRWVYAIDKHAAYLAVCGGLELGMGEAEHVRGEPDTYQLPGYWLVDIHEAFNPDVPDVWGRSEQDQAARRWVTTPTLELAIEADQAFQVREAWVWRGHQRLLRPFYETIAGARRTLTERAQLAPAATEAAAVGVALRAVKLVYAVSLGGALARTVDRDKPAGERPWSYRPDWRHQVIAKMRCNLWRNLARFRARGLDVALVHNDALYVVSDLEDGAAVALQAGVPLGDTLADFALKGRWPVDQVVEDGRLAPQLMWEWSRQQREARDAVVC